MMNKFYFRRLASNISLIKYFNLSTSISKSFSKLQLKGKFSDSESFTKSEIVKYNDVRKFGYQKSICTSADSNMYFDMYGNVSLCCYNRKYKLGNIKSQTVSEIWNGEIIKEARLKFSQNNLVSGCSMCYFNIKNHEFENTMALNYDSFGLKNSAFPSRMEFELTNVCNLECIMCNGDFSSLIRKNKENRPAIPLVYNDSFLEQLEEFLPHLQFANFLGGEPQLIKIYYTIWEKLIEYGNAIIRVQTNASILQPKFLQLVTKSKQFQISVSMDAISETLIKEIRKNINPAAFRSNLDQLIKLHKKGIIDLSFSVCPMTKNRFDLLNIIEFANSNGVKLYFNQLYSPFYLSLMNLSSNALKALKNEYIEFIRKQSNQKGAVVESNIAQLNYILLQLENWLIRSDRIEKEAVIVNQKSYKEVEEMYFKLLDKYVLSINLTTEDIAKVKVLINYELNDLSENDRKMIVFKLISLPTDLDNIDFHESKESGYFGIVKEYIKSLKSETIK